jgi:hypothetical protein
MTFIMPFRSSLPSAAAAAAAARLLRSRIVSSKRLFSSDETTGAASPLVLWLESDQPADHSATAPPPPPRILMPKFDENKKMIVSSPNDVMNAVDEHYSLSSDSQQFVGGMGEQDLGVWFASSSLDPLNHYKLIHEAIGQVKQYRHGVPFGAYTSGVNISSDVPPLQEIGLDSVQVSLIAANPNDYAEATGLSSTEATKAFGQVCGYCVTLHESGFPYQVAILQDYASSARNLAKSLGAVDTHVYQD